MIKIPLPADWWKTFDPAEFNIWITENNLVDGEWDFSTSHAFANPVMIFEYEKDAIAFRLRFGI